MTEPHPPEAQYPSDFNRILQDVGIAVFTIDDRGCVLQANTAAVAMFGHSLQAMLGHNVSMLMPSNEAARHDGYIRHYLHTGEQRIIGQGRKVQARHADGTVFPIHLAVGRVEHEGQVCFTGIIHDLTDCERDHQIAARLGRIVDQSMHEIYVFTGQDFALKIVNRSAADNLGYRIDELQSMHVPDIAPQFDVDRARSMLAALAAGDMDRMRFLSVHRRKDGTDYEVEVTLYLYQEAAEQEFVAIVEDVSERSRILEALQQSQKVEAAGQLANGVAHDFNNLLTIIEGNLELVEMQHDDAETHEMLQEARDATRLGRSLSERLMSLARPGDAQAQVLDVNQQLLSLEGFLRRALGEGIDVMLHLGPRLWLTRVDASQLETSLVNLALNARDAMLGEGRLQIDTANQTLGVPEATAFDLTPGDYVMLSVSDTGNGIASDVLERVFEPFYTTKSGAGGHGLGLSMVHGFVRQHQGAITVDSERGKGTCFTLYLPALRTR